MNGIWRGSAPSNIALIKYMGKTDAVGNRPTNRSLSFTLEGLRTHVELEAVPGSDDRWEPLRGDGLAGIELSERGRARFLAHLAFLKREWGHRGAFAVRSANDFPADCGLASSASSFAALTIVASRALAEETGRPPPGAREMAELSRRGSGSSCRSFFSPWAVWDADGADGTPLPADLVHQAVIVADGRKAVSSSEAHARVVSSPLFRGRPERAEERLDALALALREADWGSARELCWSEFWDMHALFETSRPSFGYMTAESLEVLRFAREELWRDPASGPLVTMDAGANVHFLHRAGDLAAREMVHSRFGARYRVIESSVLGRAGR